MSRKRPIKKQPKSRLTPEQYKRLLDAFREHPGKISNAARASGISRPTCMRAWDLGLAAPYEKPIRRVLEEEGLAARGLLAEEIVVPQALKTEAAEEILPEQKRADIRRDAISARAAEALMVRQARDNATELLKVTFGLMGHAVKLSGILEKAVEMMEDEPDPFLATRMLRDIAGIAKAATETSNAVMDMERKLLGDPNTVPDECDMTPEEAVAALEEATAALARARSRGMDFSVFEEDSNATH